MTPFSILLKEDVPVDPRTYGAILAPALGVTVVEARIAVRRGAGIFAENLPEDEARRLAHSLEADGVACWCAPSAALPPLSTPRRATSVETTEEGLRCALLGQTEPVTLPWDRIGAVSIGLVLLPELEEIAGVRKKDVAAVTRREQEQRDLVRDRLLAVLNRIDLAHQENAPSGSAHHYFFDQLRRKESKQLKAFADVVSDDGAEWWRIPLEESNYRDSADRGLEVGNYTAVPVLYGRLKEAHTERSRKLFQGGNVERLAFDTMEDFNRYTRWWTWREFLRAKPEVAESPPVPVQGGNGQAAAEIAKRTDWSDDAPAKPKFSWKRAALSACLLVTFALFAGVRFERRGAQCLVCQRVRQDKVLRLWGFQVKETLGGWKVTGSRSPYDEIVGANHAHLYNGYGYEREWLFGLAPRFGRDTGGNASPEEVDACDCASGLFAWHATGQATAEEVKAAYPRLFERVRGLRDPAGRRRWLDLSRAQPDSGAPENLMKEISK